MKVLEISSFGLGNYFIVRFTSGQTRHLTLENERGRAVVNRLIRLGGFKPVMSIGGYDLYKKPLVKSMGQLARAA